MQVIYTWPIWVVVLLILLLDAAASLAGYRFAPRLNRDGERGSGIVTGLRSSTIGFVALLLGFSFSITSSRFNERQHLVNDEANAIGTCYLRAGLLSQPARDHIRDALRRYTDSRLENFARGNTPHEYVRTSRAMAAALDDLWEGVGEAVQNDADRVRTSFLVLAANEVIDLSATHVWSDHNQMPPEIVALLAAAIVIAGFLIGQSLAETGRKYSGLWLALNVLVMLVVFVVLDLDRPLHGLIVINQQPLVELRATMKT